jgi:UDP-N-acetylglucosamine 1-carboxyvinyltransferase
MDKMRIKGGAQLNGTVAISGAKNAALPLIFSTLLAKGSHRLSQVPDLMDIHSSMQLMESIGCKCSYGNGQLTIDVGEKLETLAHYDQVRKMRASILVLGPLLARFGRARVSLPGGCAIGARPVGMHLDGLKQMGARIDVVGGYVEAQADRLRGTSIHLPFATVGGTENLMMAACLAEGITEIHNAAREPEIVDLAQYLNTMGAQVSGAGTSVIQIHGQDELRAGSHQVIPDRIEAGTLVVAAVLTGGQVKLTNCHSQHLESFLSVLKEMGVEFTAEDTQLTIGPQTKSLKPTDVTTEPYPGYPTDLQAQLMTLMTQVPGQSSITETVFENRFMHVSELMRLGAQIDIQGKKAIISGGQSPLVGAPVMATDLRASACLILAGLVAQGETLVSRIYHLDRGYERLENKLSALGAEVTRIKS